jgi:outer membrane protein OmpA-like peptidoglycan-associated protein
MRWSWMAFILLPIFLAGQSEKTEYKTISIFFGGGSYYIEAEEKEKVREFLSKEILTNFEIHIHSHTDNIGGAQYNQWLSKMRSESAYNFLESDGVPMNKVFIKDHGLYNPEFDNATSDGRLKNRRVDIVLWPLPF